MPNVTQLVRFEPSQLSSRAEFLTATQFCFTVSQEKIEDSLKVTDAILPSTGSLPEKVQEHQLNRRFQLWSTLVDMGTHMIATPGTSLWATT